MAEQPVVIQKISWSDLCPWTVIFKALTPATSVTVLVVALLGVVVSPMGWAISEFVFVDQELNDDPIFMEMVERNRSPYRAVFEATQKKSDSIEILGLHLSGPRMVFRQLVQPFKSLFHDYGGKSGLRKFFYFLVGCVWMLFTWTFVGLMISRVCLLRLTRNEQLGLDDVFEYGLDHWLTTAGAIGTPLIAVAVLCIPAFVIGLLLGFDVGVVVAGLLWFIVLICSGLIGVLLLGLMFGFPLIVASVGCEGQNSFDAMTRSFAYTFQRPLHYLFYATLAILFGGLCWLVIANLTNAVVDLSFWSTSWGANLVSADRIDTVRGFDITVGDGEPESGWLDTGRSMIGLWNALLRTVAAAFIYGLFWCMASAVYLLLRKDVDETEMDEIYLADERRTYQLPPLQSDENGIPVVQDAQPVEESTENDNSSWDNEENRPAE